MAINYTEKRNFIRLETNSTINYKIAGSDKLHNGQCINLSSTGVLFSGLQPLSPGTSLEINIIPTLSIVEPLIATAEVVRTVSQNLGKFEIAAQIVSLQ